MEKWWIIEGVRNPAYINFAGSYWKYYPVALLAYVIVFLSFTLLESAGILPVGSIFLAITISLFTELILRFSGLYPRRLTRADITYIKNLLRALSRHIVKWAIPSREVPVVALLDNKLVLIVHYGRSGLELMVVKPLVHYTVRKCKPRIRIKKVYRNKVLGKEKGKGYLSAGLLEIIYPHLDIRNMCYESLAKAIKTPILLDYNKFYGEIVSKFEEYTSDLMLQEGGYRVYPSHRRYSHTRSS
ncbi:MAG: hypothetical protein ABWW65_03610 [Thermoprotei archaeon]